MTFQRRVFGPGDKRASIGRNKTCRLGGQASPLPPPSLSLHIGENQVSQMFNGEFISTDAYVTDESYGA